MIIFTLIGIAVVGIAAFACIMAVGEAMFYAAGVTFVCVAGGFKPGTKLSMRAWAVIRIFCVEMRSRLFGIGTYSIGVTANGWEFRPPFSYRRISGNESKDEVAQ